MRVISDKEEEWKEFYTKKQFSLEDVNNAIENSFSAYRGSFSITEYNHKIIDELRKMKG